MFETETSDLGSEIEVGWSDTSWVDRIIFAE